MSVSMPKSFRAETLISGSPSRLASPFPVATKIHSPFDKAIVQIARRLAALVKVQKSAGSWQKRSSGQTSGPKRFIGVDNFPQFFFSGTIAAIGVRMMTLHQFLVACAYRFRISSFI